MENQDYWPTLYSDLYAVKRIEKSLELADIRPGMTVLDVGCHMGELESYMPIEVMYNGIDHLNGHDIDGGFELDSKFDRIICLETLEHLKYPKRTLLAIKDHLADDGFAVISLPNEATLFHRIRSFFGTPDAECFSECGKHLHLPSLKQARQFIKEFLSVDGETYYINPSASASRQSYLGFIMKLIPDQLWQFLANKLPSLFARGWIFRCSKYGIPPAEDLEFRRNRKVA